MDAKAMTEALEFDERRREVERGLSQAVGQQPIGPGVTKREYRKPETREWDGGLRDGRRYQVAGWVLQGFAQSGVVTTFASDVTADRRVVERAVQLADLLLKRLEEP